MEAGSIQSVGRIPLNCGCCLVVAVVVEDWDCLLGAEGHFFIAAATDAAIVPGTGTGDAGAGAGAGADAAGVGLTVDVKNISGNNNREPNALTVASFTAHRDARKCIRALSASDGLEEALEAAEAVETSDRYAAISDG